MADDPERYPDEQTVVIAADARASGEEEWPLNDLYRVEPENGVSIPAANGDGRLSEEATVVLAEPAAVPPRRRLPPAIWAPMLAIAATVGAIILVAILLGLRDDDSPSRQATATPSPGASRPGAPAATSTSDATLPDLDGMTLADARKALEELGARVRVVRGSSQEPRGAVLRQQPASGAAVERGDVVTLTVSRGTTSNETAATADVPSVVGLSAAGAVAALRAAGFVPRIRLVTSSEPAGRVLEQSPEDGVEEDKGSVVQIEVARSKPEPARIAVPDLVGETVDGARRRLQGLGLTVGVRRVASPEPAGTVLRQAPGTGAELTKGRRVTLTVSSGPAEVDVPDVTGLDEASARVELEAAGLEVQVTYEPTEDADADGLVTRQSPSGGSTAADGSTVTLVVARLA